jgi:hypothetical protein
MVYALESVWIRAMAKEVDVGAVAIDVQLFDVSFSEKENFGAKTLGTPENLHGRACYPHAVWRQNEHDIEHST